MSKRQAVDDDVDRMFVHQVSALEWDEEGTQLLIATTVGEVVVYGQKDYLLNDWTCLYNASFPGQLHFNDKRSKRIYCNKQSLTIN